MTATPEPAPPHPSPTLTALPAGPPLWRDRRFMLLTAARTISVLGNGFARVALSFAVLALPGAGPGQLSLVLACQAVPQLAFVLVGGVLADRMSRSRLMIVADLVGAAAYAGLAAMVLTGHAPLWALCSLAALAGTATALCSSGCGSSWCSTRSSSPRSTPTPGCWDRWRPKAGWAVRAPGP
ncbi:MFS transporter [Streptomyces sp. C184]|uniref:MFS transporter n=1 Tax=Streptomyces sp. C184 TaxID=3237121 RepID=UPI0034C6BDB8